MMELRNAVRGIDRGSFADHNNNNNNNNINNNNNKKPTNILSWQEEQQTDPKFYGDDYFLERLRHSTHWSRSDYATSLRSWLKRFLLWATERAERSDFCLSAAYSNTAPGMLSLARIIAKHHFFCRPDVLQLTLLFFQHSNPEPSYQKTKDIKEQAVRVLLIMITISYNYFVCHLKSLILFFWYECTYRYCDNLFCQQN